MQNIGGAEGIRSMQVDSQIPQKPNPSSCQSRSSRAKFERLDLIYVFTRMNHGSSTSITFESNFIHDP